MVELRIERENRIARLYFIQGICVEKRDRIWIADVLLKEVRLRDNTINGKLEETRAKEVEAAVEANRLKAIGDNAKVGSKRIVNLNSELERLQARQNELKSAGIGSGYKEFDSNTRRMPENLLRKIVSEESGKGTGMIKLVVNLDSRTVLERLINTAKEMQMSNGQNVFELGR